MNYQEKKNKRKRDNREGCCCCYVVHTINRAIDFAISICIHNPNALHRFPILSSSTFSGLSLTHTELIFEERILGDLKVCIV
ncbi:hypothetical protein CR513_60057, partial [Mucuna pruriens]